MGEKQNQPFQFSFNSSLKVDFQGSGVTSDGGLVLVRELDERLGFGELIERHLADARGKNTQLPLAELLTQADNLAGLGALNRELIAKAETIDSPHRVVLDMDSTEIPVYGEQEQ